MPSRDGIGVTTQKAQESKSRTPPLKSIKDGAPQVHNLNSDWTYGSRLRTWSADNLVECKRPGHPSVASTVFSLAMFGVSLAGASSAPFPGDDAVIGIEANQMPPELVEPEGGKLGQMIRRAGFRGPNARGQYMQLAQSIRSQAPQDGTYATGDFFTHVNNPDATVYRVGDTSMAVAKDGTILSYVQGADPSYGIVVKYQQLGGK